MQINFTFCIQIINFFIAYWFLDKFLFKPVLDYMKKDQDADNKIKSDIENKKEVLLSLEKVNEKEKTDFKLLMQEKYQIKKLKEAQFPELKSCFIDSDDKVEIDNLVDKARDLLEKRVPHVD